MAKSHSDLKEGVDYILNKEGKKVNPETGKELKGFALNPLGRNVTGRPKGSRNKATLLKAQLKMDSATEQAAEFYEAMMNNDTEALGISDDVPLTLRLAAAKEIMNKAIANESNKEPQAPAPTEKEEEDTTPIFSSVPVASNE